MRARESGTTADGDRGRVVAEFRDRASLHRAVRELTNHSVPTDSIQVYVRSLDGRRREVPVEEGAGTLRGALVGAAVGGFAGLLIVVLVVSGAFGEPRVGFFGLGGIAGAVRTILLTAAAAVPLGALIGMGRWRSRADISDHELEQGGAEVVVTSEAMESEAREILRRSGAIHTSG
jgi:hypothetical protein